MVWADDAASITCLAVPTPRNLAGATPGVNKFGWLEYAKVRQKWLPSLGTSVFLKALPSPERTLCTSSKIHCPAETFYPPYHRHQQRLRERFIKPSGCGVGGRSAHLGTLYFSNLQRTIQDEGFLIFRARFLNSTTVMFESRRLYELSLRNRRSAQTVFG
jgi:hypothetical protein